MKFVHKHDFFSYLRSRLFMNVRFEHEKIGYYCDQCSSKYRFISDLKIHIQFSHKYGNYPFARTKKCQIEKKKRIEKKKGKKSG